MSFRLCRKEGQSEEEQEEEEGGTQRGEVMEHHSASRCCSWLPAHRAELRRSLSRLSVVTALLKERFSFRRPGTSLGHLGKVFQTQGHQAQQQQHKGWGRIREERKLECTLIIK